jgi:OOP family OmpA-OmpF porin
MFITCGVCSGQNLVPNPSFENYTSCPHNYSEFNNYVSNWTVWKNNPDYWNACDTGPIASVPYNCGGYQQAASGSAYAGIHTFSAGGLVNGGYKEYIGVQLTSPLIFGIKYYVTFKVSATFLDSNCTTTCKTVNNKLGAFFSTIGYSFPSNQMPIPNFAKVYTNNIISDTANWTTIKGSFIADSAYQYVAIGNFFADSLTASFIMNPNGNYNLAYYYVDDVCVSTDSLTCNSTVGINEIKNNDELILFPNPFSDKLTITSKTNQPLEITLFDITSQKLIQQQFTNSTTINTSHLSKGIYIYELRTKNGVIKKGKVVKD